MAIATKATAIGADDLGGVVPPGSRGAVRDADERSDYRPAERIARPYTGDRSA